MSYNQNSRTKSNEDNREVVKLKYEKKRANNDWFSITKCKICEGDYPVFKYKQKIQKVTERLNKVLEDESK